MTESQKQAIKNAYADLVGAYESHMHGDLAQHDWKAHLQSIVELEAAFEFIEPVDLPEVEED